MADSSIPTAADWGDPGDDLDRLWARGFLSGKTRAEAVRHFEDRGLSASEALAFAPPVPFRYYMIAFMDYVMGPARSSGFGLDAANAASAFLGLIAEKLENCYEDILPIMPELMPACRYVASHQEDYGASEGIYGSFSRRLRRIEELYSVP